MSTTTPSTGRPTSANHLRDRAIHASHMYRPEKNTQRLPATCARCSRPFLALPWVLNCSGCPTHRLNLRENRGGAS
jgi:hypothetical protein